MAVCYKFGHNEKVYKILNLLVITIIFYSGSRHYFLTYFSVHFLELKKYMILFGNPALFGPYFGTLTLLILFEHSYIGIYDMKKTQTTVISFISYDIRWETKAKILQMQEKGIGEKITKTKSIFTFPRMK